MNNTLRVGLFYSWPLVNDECVDDRVQPARIRACEMPGLLIDVKVLRVIAKHANITVQYINLPDNHSAVNYLEEMNHGHIDMSSFTFMETQYRRENFDLSYPLYSVSTKLAVRRTQHPLRSMFNFFTVYGYQTWMALFSALFLFTSFGIAAQTVEQRFYSNQPVDVSELIWQMIRLQLRQFQSIKYKFASGKLALFVFAFFQCTIVLSLYQSYIMGSVVRLKDIYPFRVDDLTQVLTDRRYSFVVYEKPAYKTYNIKSWLQQDLQNSYKTPFYELRSVVQQNPLISMDNETELLDTVSAGGKILVVQDDDQITRVANKRCKLVFMNSPFPDRWKMLMFRKGYPLLDKINKAILDEQIHLLRIKNKYFKYEEISSCIYVANEPKPLKLAPYFGAFLILFFGVTMGALTFVAEFSLKNKR